MRAKFWSRDLKERDHLKHLNIDGRTIFKCISNRMGWHKFDLRASG